MIQIRILVVLLASVMSMNIWAQTAFEFDFDDKSLKNTGTKSGTATSIGKPITSDSVLYLNGESGIEIKNTGNIEVISLLFQSDLPINPNQSGKELFYSSGFGAFVSSYTYSLVGHYIGWMVMDELKMNGSKDGAIDMKWHHFMLVYEVNTYRMFLDGQELKQVSNTGAKLKGPLSSETMRFGIHASGRVGFKGSLDNIKIYNKPLSVAELNQLIATEKQHVEYLNVKYENVVKVKPGIHLEFSNNLQNSGLEIIQAEFKGTAFVSKEDSLLVLDGEGGVSMDVQKSIKAYSFLFKSKASITAISPRQVMFHSEKFGGYFSDFTEAFSDETVGFAFTPSNHRVYGNSVPIDTSWHHLLFRFTEGDKDVELYIDGEKRDLNGAGPAKLAPSVPKRFTIGATDDLLNGFKGYIDNVMIFSDNVYDSDVEVLNRLQKALLEKLNKYDDNVIRVKPGIHLEFDNNLQNSGLEIIQAELKGTAFVSKKDSLLVLDGEGGVSMDVKRSIKAYSFLFKSVAPITATSPRQVMFHSESFGGYFSNFTEAFSDETVGFAFIPSNHRVYGNSVPIDTSWHHLLFRFTEDDKDVELYIDGEKRNLNGSGPAKLAPSVPNRFTIGATDNLLNGFKGYIDNVMIFSNHVDDSDVDLINISQKALLEKLNKKDLSSLMTGLRAYYKFDNTLEDEIGGLDMRRLLGTVQYVTDISGNSMLDLDGKTVLHSNLVLDTLGGFSCYFKLNENVLTPSRMLFSSHFDKTRYQVTIGNVTSTVSNEVISVVRVNDGKVPSLQYTTGHEINSSWYHIFINFNIDDKRYDIYLNGNKIVSSGEIEGSILKLKGVTLGTFMENLLSRNFLIGYIDEVKFYGGSQSESVIMDEYKKFEKNISSLNVITSIERFDGVEPISVYPNPLNDEMKLIIKGVDNPHYRVLTMDGSILTEGQGEEIALPSACKGVFMVEVISNHVRNVFKVVR